MEILLKILAGLLAVFGIKALIKHFILKWGSAVQDFQVDVFEKELIESHEKTLKEKEDYEKAKKEFDEFLATLDASERWKRKGPKSGSDN